MKPRRIAICSAQVPFRTGGAEILAASLQHELVRRGYRVDMVQLPFKWYPRVQILKSCLAWRMLDLTESDGDSIDLVIATKFPSYAVKHPRKVTWLVHQFRQVYDQYGTSLSDFTDSDEDVAYRDAIRAIDDRTLRESMRLYSIARNVADRLARFNGLTAETLYPPPKLQGQFRNDEYGDYVFTVSRLDRAKRIDLLIQAMARVQSGARLVIAGAGPERASLERQIENLNVADRVTLYGYASDDDVIRLYAQCCAVAFVPFDEDYGYVTLEAFSSGKPIITTVDSGGVLEFVHDGVNGYVAQPDSDEIAARIDRVWNNRRLAEDLGHAGQLQTKDITWDAVVDHLVF